MKTANDLWKFIEAHRRIHGRLPRLRECVEHFDGKLLNVLMCLGELGPERADAVRHVARDDSKADREAKNKRQKTA